MIQHNSRLVPSVCQTSVAILAGGQSSRMGSDKAMLRLQQKGPTLLERVIAATSSLTGDLFVVSRSEDDYRGFGVPVVADRVPGTGVLGAIGTALQHAMHSNVLVVSCDMPFLNEAALSWMTSINDQCDAIVPVFNQQTHQGGDFTYQTLHAVYRRSCLQAIESELRKGNRKVISFFDKVIVRQVSEMEMRAFDPELLTFMSVNTPEALQQAAELERVNHST